MSDLISKSEYGKALAVKIETIRAKIKNCPNHFLAQSVINDWESEIEGLYDAAMLLDKASTVDAVEVARCKDCKYSTPDIMSEDFRACWQYHTVMPNDGFCSYGERKEVSGDVRTTD